jgi:hypothetical protein
MVVGLEPFVAAQGGMTRLTADLAWNPATATIATATTVAAMATISVTAHGCATTTSTMEHNIGAQLQVLLMFLLRLHLSLGSEELREEVVEGLRLGLGHKRLDEWVELKIKTGKNIADHLIVIQTLRGHRHLVGEVHHASRLPFARACKLGMEVNDARSRLGSLEMKWVYF